MKRAKKRKHKNSNQESTDSIPDTDARIQQIQKKRWVNYPQAVFILRRLELIYSHPRTERMPSMLIYADSGRGKTMLAKKFFYKHPPTKSRIDGARHIPVLYIETPPSMMDDRDLYMEILTALGAPYPLDAKPATLRQLAIKFLRLVECKVLVIDEVNNMLAGTARQLRAMLNALRYLSNQVKISLVCLGLRSALNIMAGDDQLANRMESHALLPLKIDGMAKFMKAIVSHYPLRLDTDYEDRQMIEELLTRTSGNLGRIVPVLQDAAIFAIEKGIECITPEVLKNIADQPPLVAMQAKQQVTA